MSFLGKIVRLRGKTQKGKNRVRTHGESWFVFAEVDTVLFSPNDIGPWMFLTPVGYTHDHKSSRWVKCHNDVDFEVIM